MATTIFDAGARDSLVQRLLTLTPERRARWGGMTAPQMVSHLIESCRFACGDLKIEPMGGPLRFFPLNYLIVHWLPWPKGAPTAAELVSRSPEEWNRDVDELVTRIRKFCERGKDRRWPVHPVLGHLSEDSWGVLVYRHIDHHFEQFGI